MLAVSKLYASISSDASRTEATRRGHKHISTHTRGRQLGVRVDAGLDHNGREVFEVYVTSGSGFGAADDLIGRVAIHDGYRYFFPVMPSDERRSREQARWLAEEERTA